MRINPAVGKKNKTYSPSQGRNAQKNTGHQEVDLVPIMNLFVTLIPMLLSMVVLVSIAYISVDLTNPNATGSSESSAGKNVDKKVPEIKKLELVINVDDQGEIFIFNKNGEPDADQPKILVANFRELSDALVRYRNIMLEDKYGDSSLSKDDDKSLSIIIVPKDYVKFGVFVKTMDLCKKMKFSDIMIGEI
jgi:biopolymer transport protein ExbD